MDKLIFLISDNCGEVVAALSPHSDVVASTLIEVAAVAVEVAGYPRDESEKGAVIDHLVKLLDKACDKIAMGANSVPVEYDDEIFIGVNKTRCV